MNYYLNHYTRKNYGGTPVRGNAEMEIDFLIKDLQEMKEKGATHVEFDINRVENNFIRYFSIHNEIEARRNLIRDIEKEIDALKEN